MLDRELFMKAIDFKNGQCETLHLWGTVQEDGENKYALNEVVTRGWTAHAKVNRELYPNMPDLYVRTRAIIDPGSDNLIAEVLRSPFEDHRGFYIDISNQNIGGVLVYTLDLPEAIEVHSSLVERNIETSSPYSTLDWLFSSSVFKSKQSRNYRRSLIEDHRGLCI